MLWVFFAWFSLSIGGVFPLLASEISQSSSDQDYQKEMKELDGKIKKLQIERDKHAALAAKYQQEGDRWQYTTGNIQDAYALWAKADEERKKMAEIQEEIDALESKKNLLYQFNLYRVDPE